MPTSDDASAHPAPDNEIAFPEGMARLHAAAAALAETPDLTKPLEGPVTLNSAAWGGNPPWFTLAVIMGNERHHIERFLQAFEPWVDEIVMVRALGSLAPDDTFELAAKCCKKPLVLAEYQNAPNMAGWPHVDNFAAARQKAFDLAGGEFVMWADADDIMDPDHAKLLREAVDLGDFDVLFIPYRIIGHHPMMRERVIRKGLGRWVNPVHEAISLPASYKAKHRTDIEFLHHPKANPDGQPKGHASLERNLRILEWAVEPAALNYFYLHRDSLLQGKPKDALEWGKLAIAAKNLTPAEKYKVYYNLALMFLDQQDFNQCESFAMNGMRLCPERRECFAAVALSLIERKEWKRALVWIQLCRCLATPPQKNRPNWFEESWYTWRSDLTEAFILRKLGLVKEAEAIEDDGHGGKPIISLLHASRGRAEQAIAMRDHAFSLALKPEYLEHIFAIDEDDEQSMANLRGFRHVVVPAGGGCVAAWNAAAAMCRGKVLVQISDDWILTHHWDNQLLWALKDPVEQQKPAVLAISDGHRKDNLLCMAILTREYYRSQKHEATGEPYLFHPDYKGVFSDNEFTVRAYENGVVIRRPDIVFQHQHPFFGIGKLDETYAAQNDVRRYEEGMAIFNRRNPRYKVEPAAAAPAEELPESRPADSQPVD